MDMNLIETILPMENVVDFCQRWHIRRLAVFGSVLRDDFSPESDIDLLVDYDPRFTRTLSNQIAMKDEITALLGREVDLMNRRAIKRSMNLLRKDEIL